MNIGGIIEWAMANLSYWVVFLLMVMENSVVPLPAELIVTPAAYKAANGEMNVVLLIALTTLGSTLGAIINYYLSLKLGRPVIYRFVNSRWGHMLFLNQKKMEYAEHLFRKNGNISTFIGRLLPAGRQFISIPAGLARMNIWAFIFYTTVGSALWNSFLVGMGYYLAYLLPQDEIAPKIEEYGMQLNIAFSALSEPQSPTASCAATSGADGKKRTNSAPQLRIFTRLININYQTYLSHIFVITFVT